MPLPWFRNRRRAELFAQPFPTAWHELLARRSRHYRGLQSEQQSRLHDVVRALIAEKRWVGYDLEITEAMQVVIAANAALLTLGFRRPYYFDQLDTIVVHRSVIVRTAEQAAENPWLGPPGVHTGEAWHRGPVILSWSAVDRESAGSFPGRNVVLHEFAHHLDGLAGPIDGRPPLANSKDQAQWYAVTEAEYLRLVGSSQRDEATILDHYGANDRSEFFAVATECFFELPHALRRRHQELYDTLRLFYHQDPASWLAESSHDRAAIRRVGERGRGGRQQGRPADDQLRLQAYRTMSAPDALFSLALDHLDGGRFEDAARLFTTLLENDPDDSESLSHRAIARYHLGKADAALADCDAALSLDPDDVDALSIRGEVLFDRGAHEEALRDLTIAVAVSPADPDVRLRRGAVHRRLGNWRKAIDDLTESILADAHQAEAYWQRAQAYRGLGQESRARTDFDKARLLDPQIADGRNEK